jgi:hypothetical protein
MFSVPFKTKHVGTYNFQNPGSLKRRPAFSFNGRKYSTQILKEDVVLYRAGVEGRGLGEYFSVHKPASELQARIDSAVLPKWPEGGTSVIDTGYSVHIPKNTTIHVGETATQGNIFVGGTQQIYIETPWLNPNIKVLDSYPLNQELLWNLQAK